MGKTTNCCAASDSDFVQVKYHSNDSHSEATAAALKEHFPGAITGHEAEALTNKILKQLGFTADNTLFSDSTSPDEVNHDDPAEDITALF